MLDLTYKTISSEDLARHEVTCGYVSIDDMRYNIFSRVFQSYQGDGMVIRKGYVLCYSVCYVHCYSVYD